MMKTLSLLAAVLGFAGIAHADVTGYVCQSGWVPNPAPLQSALANTGAYGIVYSYVYSQPKCAGTQLGMAYFCTVGATNTSWCQLNQLMNETQAAHLASSLQAAGAAAQKVTLYAKGNAGSYVEFTQP